MLKKGLKNLNTPLIVAVFLVLCGLASTWFLGETGKSGGKAFFKKSTLVSTAEGAGNISVPTSAPAAQDENEISYGMLKGVGHLNISVHPSSIIYSDGSIKDGVTPFGLILDAASSR
jgi:hypothetical protein